MTDCAQAVLHYLAAGWKLRLRASGIWRLRHPHAYTFNEVPGGKAAIDELTFLGYIDAQKNLTEAGRSAFIRQVKDSHV